MKYALVDDDKVEATREAQGICQGCGAPMIAKCGPKKINHWAHKSKRKCDPWWENETPWHRGWKNQFPKAWQEVVHCAEDGEKHIADVKTANDWVIEFQHSFLKIEERIARINFYEKIVWVIDGLRRKRDIKQFEAIIKDSRPIAANSNIYQVHFSNECKLIKEWLNNKSCVFFDFQTVNSQNKEIIWLLLPHHPIHGVFVTPFYREQFIEAQILGFDSPLKKIIEYLQHQLKMDSLRQEINRPRITQGRPTAFHKYLIRKRRNWRL